MTKRQTNKFETTIADHLNNFENEFGELDKIILISKGNDIRLLLLDEIKVRYIG
jgi:hypothetical protein